MSFLQLDEYSIHEIFQSLDIESHKKLSCTCKFLHTLSKQFYSTVKFQKNIQCDLIEVLFQNHNRDDIANNFRLWYQTVFTLKAFNHVLNACRYLQHTSWKSDKADGDEIDIKHELILKSITPSVTTSESLRCLCEIGFQSRIDMNFWYSFKLDEGVTAYLCNVKHPEFEIRHCGFENVVIGIYYNENLGERKFYCCNVAQFDWFVSELRYVQVILTVLFSSE